MKNALWSAVYELFAELDVLMSRGERFEGERPAAPGQAAAADAAQPKRGGASKAAFFKAYVEKDDLVEVRAKLRARLDVLKAAVAGQLTEREGFLVLFPLVIVYDELVQNRFVAGGGGGTWPPLQTELFRIDNGGEAFYDTLDDLLRKPDTLPFIYEVFYLCLSHGFRGRYAENPAKIAEYEQKLEAKIPTPTVPRRPMGTPRGAASFASFPAWRYGAVAAGLTTVYVALRLVMGYFAA